MKNRWFKIVAKDDTAEISIFGDIGASWWGDSLTAAEFKKEFDAIIAWLDAWNRKQRRKEVFAWWYALKSWWANWS